MEKHTPTPWQRQDNDIFKDGQWLAKCIDGRTTLAHENAAFIVRAVNAHEELLGALKVAKNCLKENRGPSMDEFHVIQQAIAKTEGL